MTTAPLPSAAWWHRSFVETVADLDHLALDRAAVLLSAYGSRLVRTPDDVETALARLDTLAEQVRSVAAAAQAAAGSDHRRALFDAWHRVLFVDHGLTGDVDDYHDVRNSFLPDVLHRRVGIPISLAVVGIEVGRRVGLPMWGIGMPGHFLIGHPIDDDPRPRGIGSWSEADHAGIELIDPFHAGEVLAPHGAMQRFARLFGAGRVLEPQHLDPVHPVTILIRMLANLKQNEARRRDLDALARIMRLRLALPGAALDEHREAIRLLDATGAIDEALWALDLATEQHGPSPLLDEERRRLAARLS